MRGKLWLDSETHLLEMKAGEMNLKQIQQCINKMHEDKQTGIYRSEIAVRKRANKLGVSLKRLDDNLSCSQWSRQFGFKKYRVYKWVKRGFLIPKSFPQSNQYIVSVKQMRFLAKNRPDLFHGANYQILEYFFGMEIAKKIINTNNRQVIT